MDYFIDLGKVRADPDPIPRSLREGPNYLPHWRFLVSEEHLLKVAKAKKKSDALNDILLTEKDPFVRQFVLYQSGRRSVIANSIEYALQCRRSESGNPIAGMIPAMIVAGRSAIQIAEDLATEPRHIVAYEKMFFDVRRYRTNLFWIKNLCYSAGGTTLMQQNAARWLVTACERGWPGLGGAFSTQPWPKYARAGKMALNRTYLALLSRAADYITALDIAGVAPSERDLDWFLQMRPVAVGAGITLPQLEDPLPVDPERQKRNEEADESIARLSLESRKKVTHYIDKITHQATLAQQADEEAAAAGTAQGGGGTDA
jgi:hypothetical protein